ncbi:MAG: hypothetical protein AB4352_13270 [Hormoscilla sp.]
MSDIVNPTVDLFLYDLRESLGDTDAEAKQRRKNFKEKLPANVRKDLFAKDNRVEAEYILLLDDPEVDITEAEFQDPYKGYYYPVYINDAYGLLVECSMKDTSAPQATKCFAELKEEIQQNQLQGKQPTIGQTWMIYGYLPEGSKKPPAEIAKECYAELMGSQRWENDLQGQGKLMGADIFELSQYSIVMKEDAKREATTIQDIQENHHVIIIIYPDRETLDLGNSLHHGWMRMFLFRHKVLWNYGQSRLLKHESKDNFSKIESFESDIEKGLDRGRELEFLKKHVYKMQGSFSRYIKSLRSLDLYKEMIEINLKNYQRLDVAIQALKVSPEAVTNIGFFHLFVLDFKENYLEQIIRDQNNLGTAMKLLQEGIKATESTVAVAKVKRDKNFQELVTDLGVGWAVGSWLAEQLKTGDKLFAEKPESVQKLVSVESLQYYATLLAPPVGAAIVAALLFRFGRILLVRLLAHIGKDK